MRINTVNPQLNRPSLNKVDRSTDIYSTENLPSEYPLRVLTGCAVALPLMCAYQQSPLPAFFNQALSIALWSGVLLLLALSASSTLRIGNTIGRGAWWVSMPVLWALLLASAVAHVAIGLTPDFVGAPIIANLILALALSVMVATLAPSPARLERWLSALLIGILIASVFNAFASLLQTVAPNWTDDVWIARPATSHDRASGNLRQPNQLATLMLWGLVASGYLNRRRWLLGCVCSAPPLATLLATGSRTGVISLALIAIALLVRTNRVRTWPARRWLALLLAALPLAWLALSSFTRSTAQAAVSQRLALWRDSIEIISQHPWLGVGWGQLNFAWTLTPLPHRAPDVFDHAHNLPLQLAAELGLPLALLLMLVLAASLWRARVALQSTMGGTLAALILIVLLHSLFEYPLWFSYFLLPTAILLSWLLIADAGAKALAVSAPQHGKEAEARVRMGLLRCRRAGVALSLLLIGSVIYANREYRKVAAIHGAVAQPDSLPRAIERARGSRLFGHFGDYAAIMLAGDAAVPALFARPIRHLIDERLLSAYARMLASTGDSQRAQFVVARAREFPPDAAFANLPPGNSVGPETSERTLNIRDFRR